MTHLEPHFGRLKPSAVDVACIRAFVKLKLAKKLNPATIRIFVALLSAVFVDLAERGLATGNPARGLPPSLRRLIRPTHDPKKTPFIERLEDRTLLASAANTTSVLRITNTFLRSRGGERSSTEEDPDGAGNSRSGL